MSWLEAASTSPTNFHGGREPGAQVTDLTSARARGTTPRCRPLGGRELYVAQRLAGARHAGEVGLQSYSRQV